jgi:hypothetical protein
LTLHHPAATIDSQNKEFRLSQYPFPSSPYSVPTVDYRTWSVSRPNSAAKSAAIWQLILGGFLFLCGSCVGGVMWIVPDDMMNQAIAQQEGSLPPMAGMTPVQEFRMLASVVFGAMFVLGLLLLIFALFVYRGGKLSTIFSMVISMLAGFFFLLDFASSIFQVVSHPATILPVLFILGILALTGVTTGKLISALRTAGTAQAQAMQQAYYWMMQYQQQYAAQNQAGYGYAPPPPPPPAAPVPSQSPQQIPPPQSPGGSV